MTLSVSDHIARRLAEAGCRWAFGVPGGEVLTLIDALERAGVRFVAARHEAAAGFMAEGTWHATGAPGVLVATIGPGVANAINPVANAQQDRTPLIVITGCVDPADAQSYTHQVFDHGAALAPLVKARFLVAAGAGAAIAEKAVAAATAHPPGPVHIDLPVTVAASPEPAAPVARRPAPALSRPADAALEAVGQALKQAKRPLVLVGLEAITHDAAAVVSEFVVRYGAPVITTYKAKGVIDEDNPICLGAAGLSPKADAILLPLVREADLILLIGYDPIEMRAGWRHPFGADQVVIELAGWRADHGMHRADHLLIGDLRESLSALAEQAPSKRFWAATARN
ncbi:MAG: thiamine pyrophosphate-binding protein, partial [Elsteraceae bacterium]